MKLPFIGICVVALLLGTVSIAATKQIRCTTGNVRGFAVVRGDPRLGGIGALPSYFSGDQQWFEIRYNCTGKGVLAKRVDEGVYDVLFPGNPGKVAVVSSLNQQAASASVDRISPAIFRVTIRGPIVKNDILIRREISFYIVIF